VIGFAALNPSYARATCEVVGFRLYLAGFQNDSGLTQGLAIRLRQVDRTVN